MNVVLPVLVIGPDKLALVVLAAVTKAVVANVVLLSVDIAVGAVGVPVKAGDTDKTTFPVPVSSVKANAKLAEEGAPKNPATLVPNPLTPEEIGNPVALVRVPDAGVPNTGPVIIGEVKVLLVNVSVPAKVAKIPVVGKVTFVAAVAVNVCENAPAVANVLLLANVKVAAVAGAVNVSLLILVAVATPKTGVTKVGAVSMTNLEPVPV